MRPLSPIEPTVVPSLRLTIQTLLFAMSAMNTNFCSGAGEKARFRTVPQEANLRLPIPHSGTAGRRRGMDEEFRHKLTLLCKYLNSVAAAFADVHQSVMRDVDAVEGSQAP